MPSDQNQTLDQTQHRESSQDIIVAQYSAKISDLGNIGSRYTSLMAYYISIVSALFGIIAIKEKSINDIEMGTLVLICTVGLSVCILWLSSLKYFRSLMRAKLGMLEEIEKSLPFKTFEPEHKEVKIHTSSGWLKIENYIPILFSVFFGCIIVLRILPIILK